MHRNITGAGSREQRLEALEGLGTAEPGPVTGGPYRSLPDRYNLENGSS